MVCLYLFSTSYMSLQDFIVFFIQIFDTKLIYQYFAVWGLTINGLFFCHFQFKIHTVSLAEHI